MRKCCKIWGRNYSSHIRDLQKIQHKAVKLPKFERNSPRLSKPFNDQGNMKFKDVVTLNNCIFLHDQTNKNFPDAFENYFCKKKDQHNHKARVSQDVLLDAPIKNTSRYGSNSIISRSILDWNYLIKKV